jgi:hypothetical protein
MTMRLVGLVEPIVLVTKLQGLTLNKELLVVSSYELSLRPVWLKLAGGDT